MSEEKITHGFVTTLPKENTRDGIARSVDIAMTSVGKYYITIATHWPDEAEPVETKISFTPDGIELLADALMQAIHHINQYPILED